MYEAEINTVIHAYGGKAFVDVYESWIDVTFKDKGPGILDVEEAMQEGFSTAPERVRSLGFGAGMGLSNIKRYTDDMNIKSTKGKGTTLFFSVYVKRKRNHIT